MIYLDAAATSLQKPPEVLEAVQYAMSHFTSPGRGGHRPAMDAAEAVYSCRETAGELFGCEPEQVVFTMNATHGLNIAIHSLVRPGGRVVVSALAHNAVMRPLLSKNVEIRRVGTRLFDPDTFLHQLRQAIRYPTQAVILTHISNVYGDVLPVSKAVEICRKQSIPVVIDAAQSAGILPLKLDGASFIAMPGHKGLLGPQGTGILLCDGKTLPLLHGGTGSNSRLTRMPDELPDRLEAGTMNTAGIHGLHQGLKYVSKNRETMEKHEQNLTRQLASGIATIPDAEVFSGENQLGVVSFRTEKTDCETLARRLDEAGICVRAGLHCAPEAHRTGGTLTTGTVRLSPSPYTTAAQIDQTLEILKKIMDGI